MSPTTVVSSANIMIQLLGCVVVLSCMWRVQSRGLNRQPRGELVLRLMTVEMAVCVADSHPLEAICEGVSDPGVLRLDSLNTSLLGRIVLKAYSTKSSCT